MPRYETYSKVKEVYNISSETIRNWARRGQIRYKCVQNPTRKTWLFDLDSIGEFLQQETSEVQAKGNIGVRVIYLRVSQQSQLESQREQLQILFPDAEFIIDIGSGIDATREGLTTLVRRVCRDQVAQLVVTSRNSIGRFLYPIIEVLCKEHGCTILVSDEGNLERREGEVKDELFDLVNSVISSIHGTRAAITRRKKKEVTSDGDHQSSTLSDKEASQDDRADVQCQ